MMALMGLHGATRVTSVSWRVAKNECSRAGVRIFFRPRVDPEFTRMHI